MARTGGRGGGGVFVPIEARSYLSLNYTKLLMHLLLFTQPNDYASLLCTREGMVQHSQIYEHKALQEWYFTYADLIG